MINIGNKAINTIKKKEKSRSKDDKLLIITINVAHQPINLYVISRDAVCASNHMAFL